VLKIFDLSGNLAWIFNRIDDDGEVTFYGSFQLDTNYTTKQVLKAVARRHGSDKIMHLSEPEAVGGDRGKLLHKGETTGLNGSANKICAFTMVYNESLYLPIWLKYYGKQFGFENLFVIDHGSDDGSTQDLHGANCEQVLREDLDEIKRARLISDYQHKLLEEYEFVVFSDVDEILIADPALFNSLSDYINKRCTSFVNAVGLDVLHNVRYEEKIDLTKSILAQRSYVQFTSKYCKALISKTPLTWFPGFHDCNFDPNVDHDLYLFHLKKFDYSNAVEKLQNFRNVPWSEAAVRLGHGMEYRLLDDDFIKKMFPFKDVDLSSVCEKDFNFSDEIGVFQAQKKWFEGRIVQIHDRFKSLLSP
jgi:hypothetical protein